MYSTQHALWRSWISKFNIFWYANYEIKRGNFVFFPHFEPTRSQLAYKCMKWQRKKPKRKRKIYDNLRTCKENKVKFVIYALINSEQQTAESDRLWHECSRVSCWMQCVSLNIMMIDIYLHFVWNRFLTFTFFTARRGESRVHNTMSLIK